MIKSVKTQQNGYKVTLEDGRVLDHVPAVGGNMDYELIKQWLEEGNTPEPEFTTEELAQKELDKQIQEASQYLQSTDWYYARKVETGEEVPVEVVSKRLECREFIRLQGDN